MEKGTDFHFHTNCDISAVLLILKMMLMAVLLENHMFSDGSVPLLQACGFPSSVSLYHDITALCSIPSELQVN